MPSGSRKLRLAKVAPRALTLGFIMVLLIGGWSTSVVASEPTNTDPPQGRAFRTVVFLVDFTDDVHRAAVPNHRTWQTASFIGDAFFARGLVPVGMDGRRQTTGSLADYLGSQARTNLVGDVFAYPSTAPTIDGWYQYTLDAGETPYFGPGFDRGEQGWFDFYAALFERLGVTTEWITTNYDAVYFLHGGPIGGSIRNPFGYLIGSSGLGNSAPPEQDAQPRYSWIGILVHEMMHAVTGLPDFYGNVWEGDTGWDILSLGVGSFPAPLAAWATRMAGFDRVEHSPPREGSTRVFLPDPALDRPKHLAVLDNSTVGDTDELIIEFRNHHPTDTRFDTAFMGIPFGNADGLLIANVDRQASGSFSSFHNIRGRLPDAFGYPLGAPERLSNEYSLSPIVEFKRKDGERGDFADLFGTGDRLGGSDPTALSRATLRSSANPDGDVVWSLDNLLRVPPCVSATCPIDAGFSFDATFQGRPLGSGPGPYRHRIGETGERLTGAVAIQRRNGASLGRARLTFSVRTSDLLAPVTVLDAVFEERDPLPEFSIDLTKWAGRDVEISVHGSAPPMIDVDIVNAFFFAKAERVLRDLIDEGTTIDLDSERPAIVSSPILEDGVTYDRALLMEPRSGSAVTFTSEPFAVPESGAILRGAVGYPSSTSRSDGALVRMTIDDGIHRVRVRDWTPPLHREGATFVLRGGSDADIEGFRVRLDGVWGTGLGWAGEAEGRWVGDWMRAADFDGDGRDDVAVFTGGERPRVGVARALATASFGPLERWLEPFAANGDRPMTGRFDGDAMSDIVSFTPEGDAHVARSTGARFERDAEPRARALLSPGDVPAIADADGDGLDDIVIFSKTANATGTAGRVLVARNTGVAFDLPETWLNGFCAGERVPLAGDLDRDGRGDVLCIVGDGSVRAALSTGSAFEDAGVWLAFDGPMSQATAEPGFFPAPGPELLTGPVPYLVSSHGAATLVWFNRSSAAGAERGAVYAATVHGGRFGTPERVLSSFGSDADWPLVGHFDVDGALDFSITTPTRAGVEGFYLTQCVPDPTRDYCYRGDLYVSPRPADPWPLAPVAPRLNRFTIDLSSFAGRLVSVELEAESGPSDRDDQLLWPSLKVLGLP